MKKIIYMLLLIQSGLIMAQTKTVVTPNGEKVTINPYVNNGLETDNGYIQLGGALVKPSVLTTTDTFTLALKGLSAGSLTDDVIIADPVTGVLKKINASSLAGAGSFWSLLGNAGTDPALNFLGTTDNNPLKFRINNINAGKIDLNSIGLGFEALNPLSTGAYSVAFGSGALKNNTTGQANTAIGYQSLLDNTTGYNNTAIGQQAMFKNITGYGNMALGVASLALNTSGYMNAAVGPYAMQNNTTGKENLGLGFYSLGANTEGANNVAVGSSSLSRNTTGVLNIAIGHAAGNQLVSGTKNIVIGVGNQISAGLQVSSATASNEMNIGNALFGTGVNNMTIGSANIGINTQAPSNALHVKAVGTNDPLKVEGLKTGVATDKVVVADANGIFRTVDASSLSRASTAWNILGNAGTDPTLNFLGTTDDKPLMFRIANTNAGFLSKQHTALGYDAYNTTATGLGNTAIGVSSLKANTSGNSNTAIGFWSLMTNTTGLSNTAVGSSALRLNTTGQGNTAVGSVAMQDNTTGGSNTALGSSALTRNLTGDWNTAIGASALSGSTTGFSNTGVGHFALYSTTTGNQNTSLGQYALRRNLTGNNNTSLGFKSGENVGGNNNITLGFQVLAGSNAADSTPYTGDKNIAIGDNITLSSRGASNEMNIGNTLYGVGVNNAIGTGKIGVNTNAPTTALHVVPKTIGTDDPMRVEGLKAGTATDKIVVADANGVLKTVAQTPGIMRIRKTMTSTAIVDATDDVLLIDASNATGNVTVTVPAGIGAGRVFTIKRVDTGNVTVTIQFASGTIDGADTFITVGNKVSYQIITEGSNNWQTLSRV